MNGTRKNRIVLIKKGRVTTIPLWLRKKYKIEDRSTFVIEEKKHGLLLKPVKSFWDMVGSCSDEATVEEVKAELDKLRNEEDEDDLQLYSQNYSMKFSTSFKSNRAQLLFASNAS